MAGRHRHHQFVIPRGMTTMPSPASSAIEKPASYRSHEALDLLIQRHSNSRFPPLGSLTARAPTARQARRRDAIGQGNAQLTKAVAAALTLSRACSSAAKTRETCSRTVVPRVSCVLRVVRTNRRAEFFLQFLDGAGQRRLVDVQPLGSTGEVEFFGNGLKAA
jgi:hypothetical protein